MNTTKFRTPVTGSLYHKPSTKLFETVQQSSQNSQIFKRNLMKGTKRAENVEEN